MRGSALQSKAKCQLAEVPVSRVGPSLDGNEELRCGIIRAALVLNEEQVLPLQRSSEAEIEANGVYGDVGCQARAQIVVCELGDDRVRIFDRELIQEPYIAELPDLINVDGRHNRITQPFCSGREIRLYIHVQ